jgi:hypothetical protein
MEFRAVISLKIKVGQHRHAPESLLQAVIEVAHHLNEPRIVYQLRFLRLILLDFLASRFLALFFSFVFNQFDFILRILF